MHAIALLLKERTQQMVHHDRRHHTTWQSSNWLLMMAYVYFNKSYTRSYRVSFIVRAITILIISFSYSFFSHFVLA